MTTTAPHLKPSNIAAVAPAVDVVPTQKQPGEGDDSISDFAKLTCDDDYESLTEKKEEERADNDTNNNTPAGDNNNNKSFHRSSSFIRVHDLDIPEELKLGGRDVLSSALHDSMRSQGGFRGPCKTATEGLFFVDQDLGLVLEQLTKIGLAEAVDESSRFTPGRETANILTKRNQQPSLKPPADPDWPIRPWHAASPTNIRDILIWNGMVKNHNRGFGHDWPIVKARGIIPTSPRNLVEFLWDSSNVKSYNSMSQGREDGTVFQEGFDTCAEDSPYGFPGCAKILKSYNKIKMVPRIIEIISILHARPLEPPLAAPGTYIMVNRSIWESDNAHDTSPAPTTTNAAAANSKVKMVRSEMLLAVQLIRPIKNGMSCEMTTITHALAPGVNKTVAKTAANVSAAKILRDIQTVFLNKRKG